MGISTLVIKAVSSRKTTACVACLEDCDKYSLVPIFEGFTRSELQVFKLLLPAYRSLTQFDVDRLHELTGFLPGLLIHWSSGFQTFEHNLELCHVVFEFAIAKNQVSWNVFPSKKHTSTMQLRCLSNSLVYCLDLGVQRTRRLFRRRSHSNSR